MSSRSISLDGLNCKPPEANAAIGQTQRVAGGRKKGAIDLSRARSELQRIFVERLAQVMQERGLSDNALARLIDPENAQARQSSLSRITSGKVDPHLSTVEEIAHALGLSPIVLLTQAYKGKPESSVVDFPQRPPIFGPAEKLHAKKSHDRKKARR